MSGFFSQPRAVWAVAFAAVVSVHGPSRRRKSRKPALSSNCPPSLRRVLNPPTSEVPYQLSYVGPLAPGV